MKPRRSDSPERERGLTRIELLVLLGTLTLLASVTRPIWGSGGPGRQLLCMDNFRRLQAGWLLYTEDQRGRFPRNPTIAESQNPVPGRGGWVTGVMTWDQARGSTNTEYLTDARYAMLAPYVGPDATLYRCPEDTYLSPQQHARGFIQRARSYSMNHFMGATSEFAFQYQYFHRLADLRDFPPQLASVFLEEHPDSINDPMFLNDPSQLTWGDLPGAFHSGGGWFSFVDGHVELRRWQSVATIQAVRYFYHTVPPLQPTDPDWVWVQERASRKR